MEKEILGDKIKTLRTGKGYSQEHLSGLAQISLRTVQRIENGETEARGDTLNRLAKALEVSIDELIGTKAVEGNNGYLGLVNLSGMAYLFFKIPFLGIILPLILWQIKKDRIADINLQVKKIINFQITWALVCLVLYIAVMINLMFIHAYPPIRIGRLGVPESLLIIAGTIFLSNAVQVIINAIRIMMHKEVKYWPVYRFIK